MEKMLGEIVGLAAVGIIFAVVFFLFNTAKSYLNPKKEQGEIEKFKEQNQITVQPTPPQMDEKRKRALELRLETFRAKHQTKE